MKGVPVANQGEGEQKKRDQQESRRLRCVDRMTMVLMRRITLGLWSGHANIVALSRCQALSVGR
jgi:hypothetical protein